MNVEMTAQDFLKFASEQISKAVSDDPKTCDARLTLLQEQIEIAKKSFFEAEVEKAEINVFEEQTQTPENPPTEDSPTEESPSSELSFDVTEDDVSKLESLNAQVEEALKPAEISTENLKDSNEWPDDMNDEQFEDGVRKPPETPEWGWDSKDKE